MMLLLGQDSTFASNAQQWFTLTGNSNVKGNLWRRSVWTDKTQSRLLKLLVGKGDAECRDDATCSSQITYCRRNNLDWGLDLVRVKLP